MRLTSAVDNAAALVLRLQNRGKASFRKVNKRLSIFDYSHRPYLARLLSYVLVVLVAYGSTAEAVHSHGALSRGVLPAAADTVLDAGGTSSTNTPVRFSDCLVCQFQQNLSSAELFTPPLESATEASASIIQVPSVSFRSLVRSTGQGRAPPVTC